MNQFFITISHRRAGLFSGLAAWSLLSSLAWADIRQEAGAIMSRLQNLDSVRTMSEEVQSANVTFATAEDYFKSNDLKRSEQFYLLVLQKARVILASIPGSITDTPDSVPPQPHGTPLPSDSPPPDKELPPRISSPGISSEPARDPDKHANTQTHLGEAAQFLDNDSSQRLVGQSSVYTVIEGDTIRLVAAKLGVSRQQIISLNHLDIKAYLKVGQKLRYNNRKIVPLSMKDGIVVNIPDRMLYYFKKGRLAVSIPVALGVPVKNDKYDWNTPTGKFRVTAKAKDPTWRVPPSIQSEMEEQGKEIITSISPGPTNPLGRYAIKTSLPGILIHSTIKPWSIYSYASHGCIRVYPVQMEELFKDVPINTPGEIIYRPVKLAVTEGGRVFLEVHQDVYGKSKGLAKEARLQIEKLKLVERVDWKKVDSVLRQKSGIAVDISL